MCTSISKLSFFGLLSLSAAVPDGLDDCIDGGICPEPSPSAEAPGVSPQVPPPQPPGQGPVTPSSSTSGNNGGNNGGNPEPVQSSGWSGFAGLGLSTGNP